MSTSASAAPSSSSSAIANTSGAAQRSSGESIGTIVASISASLVIFGVQVAIFLIIKNRLPRIYQPRTFLVPERERTKAPPTSLWRWIFPVFRTSNSDFIQKCGLDAYFFLRYLRTLLKIFIPLAVIILPILLPINHHGGKGGEFATGIYSHSTTWSNVTGLDTLAWGNVRPTKTNRYWAHLILAFGVIIWTCWVFYDELRGYIRLRQAYLTSPQHRLRASATTVLVSGIPPKWCTVEALEGLYDVFPGGIRNIWINRNFDDLNDKVHKRNKLAKALESAETALIRSAKKAHTKQLEKQAKKLGRRETKAEREDRRKVEDDKANAMAGTSGLSTGNPHQVRHTVDEALNEESGEPSRENSPEGKHRKPLAIPVLGQGIEAVGQGIGNFGRSIFGGFRKVSNEVDERLNPTGGFVPHNYTNFDGPSDPVDISPDQLNDSLPAGNTFSNPDNSHYPSHGSIQPSALISQSSESTMQGSSSRDHRIPEVERQHDSANFGSPVNEGSEQNKVQKLTVPPPHKPHFIKFWKESREGPYSFPSPEPHGKEEDEFPLNSSSPITPSANPQATINGPSSEMEKAVVTGRKESKWSLPFFSKKKSREAKDNKATVEYPVAYDEEFDTDNDGEPVWKKYLKAEERETMRLPIFGWDWMISLPLIGKKVDTIYYCRREVARLNVEIEQDQSEPERFPLMNSAFVQFNHQVAAHMACQSVSHHIPNQMAPRLVEISPNDVLWGNMSITWWERYLRTAAVIALIAGLIVGWGFPVAFTGLISQVRYLEETYKWLQWLRRAPSWVIAVIQGVLPQALLAILLAVLPIILRLLAKNSGVQTGMQVELRVQDFYFFFLLVQVFLIVTISTTFTTVIGQVTKSPQSIPNILAENVPKASNYFFSYLLLQALGTSAGALVQVMGLLGWFVLSPLLDNTARQKWRRQINLPTMNWGTFFPTYTNLAAIGLIYSVIAPLILVFNLITFSLFWVVYRYNTLYVTKFQFDTGGLLFPKAINQLFTGLYIMELALIGLFFLVRNVDSKGDAVGTPCKVQAILMIVALILTAGYQILLNYTFSPLFKYLPITLEDDAVIRDEEFARAQEKRWNIVDEERPGDDINDVLEAKEKQSEEQDERAEDIELREIEARHSRGKFDPRNIGDIVPNAINGMISKKGTWADRSRTRKSQNWENEVHKPANAALDLHHHHHHGSRQATDLEAQGLPQDPNAMGAALFSGLHDEIEDLTPDERDKLVRRAFQHEALRARRPVIWIPRDDLGISDDEVLRTQRFSKRKIWISNEFTGLDRKARVIFRKSPPDFSEVDLIEL